VVSERLTADAHRTDAVRCGPSESKKLGRFTRLRALSAARPKNSRSNRRHPSAGETRRSHQAPTRAATCGCNMPARSRGAMRTTWWQRTAKSLAFLAVMAAGWPQWWLIFGLGWTLVTILVGEW